MADIVAVVELQDRANLRTTRAGQLTSHGFLEFNGEHDFRLYPWHTIRHVDIVLVPGQLVLDYLPEPS